MFWGDLERILLANPSPISVPYSGLGTEYIGLGLVSCQDGTHKPSIGLGRTLPRLYQESALMPVTCGLA